MQEGKEGESRKTTQELSTQWLNKCQGLYSMYVQDLSMVFSLTPLAPSLKNSAQHALNYLDNENYLIKVMQDLKKNKDKQIPAIIFDDYKKSIEKMNEDIDEMEDKIMNEHHKNNTNRLTILFILKLIEKQLQVYKKVKTEYEREVLAENECFDKESNPFEGINLVDDDNLPNVRGLDAIKDKMIEINEKVNILKISSKYHELVRARDRLKEQIKNLIGSQVDFEQTIKLYEQRLEDINKITEKQEEIVRLQKQIKEKQGKIQTVIDKINLINNSELSKARERGREAGDPVLNHFDQTINAKLPKRKETPIRKIQLSTRKDSQKNIVYGFMLIIVFCLIVFAF